MWNRKGTLHTFINTTGGCLTEVASSVSHPPIFLCHHLTLLWSLRWLPNIPLLLDSQTTGLRSGLVAQKSASLLGGISLSDPCLAWHHLNEESATASALPSSSSAHGGSERIRSRIAQLSQDLPPPPLWSPNEVRWPDVLFLPVTTAAMKPLHKPRRWKQVSAPSMCVATAVPPTIPPPFKKPKVSAEITKDQPSVHSECPSVYDPSIGLRSTDQNRTAFLIRCCHCSCCIC